MAKKKKKYPYDEDLFKDSTMTFGEHLEELRQCLFKALLGLAIGFLIGLPLSKLVVQAIQAPLQNALAEFYEKQAGEFIQARLEDLKARGYLDEIARTAAERNLMPERVLVSPAELLGQLNVKTSAANPSADHPKGDLVDVFIWRPIEEDTRVKTKSLSAHEPFAIYIKAALLVGVLVASPWIFYQIWSFVAAGLYPHEKRYVHIFLPFSLGLFLAGAALAFFFVFEPVLRFLLTFNKWLDIDPDPRISEWLGFVLILPLGFGIGFQLPLVMLFLERIGVFDVPAYLARWRVAILVIFVLAMFLTPADPWSMLLMAVPLTALYFGGVLLCHYMPRPESPFDDEE